LSAPTLRRERAQEFLAHDIVADRLAIEYRGAARRGAAAGDCTVGLTAVYRVVIWP